MSMSYEIYGPEKAPTILFLHGGGISGWMWHNQVEALSADYRCIVPDLPEHGKSINEGILSIAADGEGGKRQPAHRANRGKDVAVQPDRIIGHAEIVDPVHPKRPSALHNALRSIAIGRR